MMLRKRFYTLFILSLIAAFFAPAKSACAAATAKDTIVKLHWLGKKSVSSDTNSAGLMTIWNMPETANVEAQFINQACSAPWRLLHQPSDTNSATLLHPLAQDLIEQEFYLEIRRSTNSPAFLDEMILAVRLNDERAGIWQTNLASALHALTGIAPVNDSPAHRWTLKKHHAPNLIESVRVGNWLVVAAAQDHNTLLDEVLSRIERTHAPCEALKSNRWAEITLDPDRLPDSVGGGHRGHLSQVSFDISGDGENLLTKGELTLSPETRIALTPWNIPTNLISDQFSSLAAVRGIKPFLASSPIWTNLNIGAPPDQLFVWAPQGIPMQTYFAAPLADASNEVARLTSLALERHASPRLTKALEEFQKADAYNGLSWKGFPFFAPFLKSITAKEGNFVFGGFLQFDNPQNKLSSETLKDILDRPNIIYYQRELSGPRLEQWLYLSQAIRFGFGGSQLPADSPSIAWFKAVVPRFGACGTDIVQTGPSTLSLARKSKVGFTAVELQLMADWLESADFPLGLHSLSAPPP